MTDQTGHKTKLGGGPTSVMPTIVENEGPQILILSHRAGRACSVLLHISRNGEIVLYPVSCFQQSHAKLLSHIVLLSSGTSCPQPQLCSKKLTVKKPGTLLRHFYQGFWLLGGLKTLFRISCNYWWASLSQDVRDTVAACSSCTQNQESHSRPAGLLHRLPVPNITDNSFLIC